MTTPHLDVFQVVADPSRRQILQLLTEADSYNISALVANFDMSRPAVSKHIKILQQSGFVSITEMGRERHCTLRQEGFEELRNWLLYFDTFWTTKLQKLDSVLAKDKKP